MAIEYNVPRLDPWREHLVVGDAVEHEPLLGAIPVLIHPESFLDDLFEAGGTSPSVDQILELCDLTIKQDLDGRSFRKDGRSRFIRAWPSWPDFGRLCTLSWAAEEEIAPGILFPGVL